MTYLYVCTHPHDTSQFRFATWDRDDLASILDNSVRYARASHPDAQEITNWTPDPQNWRFPLRFVRSAPDMQEGWKISRYDASHALEVEVAGGPPADLIYGAQDNDWWYGVTLAGDVYRRLDHAQRWQPVTPQAMRLEYEKDMVRHTRYLYGTDDHKVDYVQAEFFLDWAHDHIKAINWYFKLRRGLK